MIFDSTFLLLIPAMLFAVYAQFKVKSTYARYGNVNARSGMTGAEAARKILDANRASEVEIEQIEGTLTDHYDPRSKVLRLSADVYNGTSLAAIGVAAHEAGHAMQDAQEYLPLKMRNGFLLPVANIGSIAAWPLFLLGLLFSIPMLMDLGIIFFTAAVVFQVMNLPVEYNASGRAIALLTSTGVVTAEESKDAKKVLNAAGLTYLAAAAMALLQLIRLIILRGERD
ncbi:MAG TPA: zinc metallopeptidase [bacterium]|nr:zinc metallopeptidase [bacterium]